MAVELQETTVSNLLLGILLFFAKNYDNMIKNFGVGRTSTPVEQTPSTSETLGFDVICHEEAGNSHFLPP